MRSKTAQAMKVQRLQRTSITIPDSVDAQVRKQIEKHGAASLSEYLTGLVCLDLLLGETGPAELKDVPLWVIRSYKLDIKDGKIERVQLMKAERDLGDLDLSRLSKDKPRKKS